MSIISRSADATGFALPQRRSGVASDAAASRLVIADPSAVAPSPDRLIAPRNDEFPAFPASWYHLCASSDLKKTPIVCEAIGRRLVTFRTASGRVCVLDSRCPHQGADLARGQVVGESIRCPFHAWEWDGQGRCAAVPGRASVPAVPCHSAYPAVERHGTIYFFNGPTASFDLPFFPGERESDFVAARSFGVMYDAPWFMIAANAFDRAHFAVVHDREMVGEPLIDTPEPFSRRTRYRVRVVGDSIHDRLLARFGGKFADVEISVWAGNVVAVRAAFPRVVSFVFFVIEPVAPLVTRMNVVAYQRRSVGNPLATAVWALAMPLVLEIRRLFTQGFIRHEYESLGSLRYCPTALIEEDRPVIEYLRWVAALHRTAVPT